MRPSLYQPEQRIIRGVRPDYLYPPEFTTKHDDYGFAVGIVIRNRWTSVLKSEEMPF